MKTVNEEIREFLEDYGVTQTRLAREAGVSCPGITCLLNGKRKRGGEVVPYTALETTAIRIREAMDRIRAQENAL